MTTPILNDTIFALNNDSIKVSHDCSTVFISMNNPNNDIYSFVSNDTLFTVITTLAIFILGIIISRLIVIFDNKRKKHQTKKYFRLLANKIYKTQIPQLTDGYERFYQIIDTDNGIPQTTPKQPDSDYKRFANSDIKELLTIFNYSTKISKVISGIDYIIKLMEESEKYHEKVLTKTDKMRERIKELFESYLSKLYDYLDYERTNNPNYTTDRVWIFINDKYLKYHQDFDGKRSLTAVINEIIRPIRSELVETEYHKTKQLGREIFVLSKELYLRYSELDNITKEIRGQYKDFYEKIKQVNDFKDIEL